LDAGQNDIMSLLIRMHKLRSTMLNKEIKRFGLTSPQLFVLRELFIEQPKTLGDLSKALDLSNSTITGIIDRLERDGLVERSRDEKDRRVIWISTTDECMSKKKERMDSSQQEMQEELMKVFTPEQFGLLSSLLEKLIVHVEKKLEGTP
jgi:MarR family transcriptional regulator, organic hydroperoxide resistance regulator